jgi:hypothetical protein
MTAHMLGYTCYKTDRNVFFWQSFKECKNTPDIKMQPRLKAELQRLENLPSS